MDVGNTITDVLQQHAERLHAAEAEKRARDLFDAETYDTRSDIQDKLMSDEIGRCKRPSKPPPPRHQK